jgi:FkbM family methyltransferase
MALADRGTMISFAQNAEDVVLERAFEDAETGFYIDVGASHPADDSVTFHFYERGWRGVNIEPDTVDCELLAAARTRDINLAVAIGSGEEPLLFYPSSLRGRGTVDPELAAARGYASQIEVPQVSLARIFDEHAPAEGVDFLKVDVEGWEADVLRSADWTRHRPRVVVVEAVDDEGRTTHGEWEPPLLSAGYSFALFDGLNRFYCRVEDADRLLESLRAPANVLDDWRPAREVSLQTRLLADIDAIEAERAETHARLEREQAAHADDRRALAAERWALAAEREAHADARRELAAERATHDETRRELASVYDSTSWRITSPVRDASRLARMMRRGAV